MYHGHGTCSTAPLMRAMDPGVPSIPPGAKGCDARVTARPRPGAAAGGEEHALGGLIDRSGSRSLGPAEDASSTGSGEGRAAEATPPHLHLPRSQARLRRCLHAL